jgi:hypothetical protein
MFRNYRKAYEELKQSQEERKIKVPAKTTDEYFLLRAGYGYLINGKIELIERSFTFLDLSSAKEFYAQLRDKDVASNDTQAFAISSMADAQCIYTDLWMVKQTYYSNGNSIEEAL